jgi:hypothetical protein
MSGRRPTSLRSRRGGAPNPTQREIGVAVAVRVAQHGAVPAPVPRQPELGAHVQEPQPAHVDVRLRPQREAAREEERHRVVAVGDHDVRAAVGVQIRVDDRPRQPARPVRPRPEQPDVQRAVDPQPARAALEHRRLAATDGDQQLGDTIAVEILQAGPHRRHLADLGALTGGLIIPKTAPPEAGRAGAGTARRPPSRSRRTPGTAPPDRKPG